MFHAVANGVVRQGRVSKLLHTQVVLPSCDAQTDIVDSTASDSSMAHILVSRGVMTEMPCMA